MSCRETSTEMFGGNREAVGIRRRVYFVGRHVMCASIDVAGNGTVSERGGVGRCTSSTAVLWVRTSAPASVEVEVFPAVLVVGPPAVIQAGTIPVFTASTSTTAANDNVAKVTATGLNPLSTYYFRWKSGAEQSQQGRFVTAPGPDQNAGFRFVVAADADGFPVGGPPAFNNFETLDRARLEQPAFFSFLGDTIYSDSSFAPGPVTTLDEYRAAHAQNRSFAALRNLMSATSTYAQPDDHEVYNDYDGDRPPARYAAGWQAFHDWMPTNPSNGLVDPIVRRESPLLPPEVGHAGRDLPARRAFVPERPESRSSLCARPGRPWTSLPPRRADFGPWPGCRPRRPRVASTRSTIRRAPSSGRCRRRRSKLISSRRRRSGRSCSARTRSSSSTRCPTTGGRATAPSAARSSTTSATTTSPNVVFLTTDLHANIYGNVFIDKTTDPEPIAYEAISGPIATNTYKQEIINSVGAAYVGALQFVLGAQGVDCQSIDVYSYQLVEVSSSGTLTISSKDKNGNVVGNDTNSSIKCKKVLGPSACSRKADTPSHDAGSPPPCGPDRCSPSEPEGVRDRRCRPRS